MAEGSSQSLAEQVAPGYMVYDLAGSEITGPIETRLIQEYDRGVQFVSRILAIRSVISEYQETGVKVALSKTNERDNIKPPRFKAIKSHLPVIINYERRVLVKGLAWNETHYQVASRAGLINEYRDDEITFVSASSFILRALPTYQVLVVDADYLQINLYFCLLQKGFLIMNSNHYWFKQTQEGNFRLAMGVVSSPLAI